MIGTGVAVAGFIWARMKDAEKRGMLEQKIEQLEKRVDKSDCKQDQILAKLEKISEDLRMYFDRHIVDYHKE
jgi:chaperonin cofactor prefoldin